MTQTRIEALEELAAKIEAGQWFPGLAQLSFGGVQNYHNAHRAYNGSLDAALAFHNAVLPGWLFDVSTEANKNGYVCFLTDAEWKKSHKAVSNNPARAWLLADLKALIEKEKAGQ